MINHKFEVLLHGRVLRAYVFPSYLPIKVGRDFRCDIVLGNGAVSRQHATLEFCDKACYIVDRDSCNGVYFAGKFVTRARLEPGMMCGIHKFNLRYVGMTLVQTTRTGDNHAQHAHASASDCDMPTIAKKVPGFGVPPLTHG